MRGILLLFLFSSSCLIAANDLLADFEDEIPKTFRFEGLTSSLSNDNPPQGKSALKLEPAGGGAMRCFISLPENIDLTSMQSFNIWIKIDFDGTKLPLVRCFALDSSGKPLFQRLLDYNWRREYKSGEWVHLIEPLMHFPWARGRVGDWAAARSLVITIEGELKAAWFDDISFTPGAEGKKSAFPTREWLQDLAFEKDEVRAVNSGDVWIVTGLLEEISAEQLTTLLKKVSAARMWLKNSFGTAYRTADPGRPISVMILKTKGEQSNLFARLGASWKMQVMPSNAGGYTVLDIATIPPAPLGKLRSPVDRPVYLHEAVHAMVGRDLRIVSGGEFTNWFQEGIANYIQLCVNPESLDRGVYVKNFAKAIDADGKSFFKPMKMLLTTPATSERYAQLASVVAFLAEKRREWLQGIAAGLGEGESIEKILPKMGVSFEGIEKEWVEWGRAAFKDEKGRGIFETPQEFDAILGR
jgi:hypothetical protein